MQQNAASTAKRPRLRPGDQLRLTLGPIANRGAAIAHTDEGLVVFVHFGVPGEEVRAEVFKAKKDHVEARVVEVLRAAPDRIEPRCEYFGVCGGCNFQHLPYERQLEMKHAIVVETLARIGGLREVDVPATVPAPSPWAYRNQARFSCNRWGEVGFTRRGTHYVLPIKTCYILQPPLGDLLPVIQGKGEGLHQIVARCGVNTGDLLLAPDLADRGVEVAASADNLTERVAGETFTISPSSFFQVNTAQAERMVQLADERLQLTHDDVLADLYAGG